MPRLSDVAIPADKLRELEALPVRRSGAQWMEPQPWQVEALRKYWHTSSRELGRDQRAVARVLGVGIGTARRWYRQYIAGGDGHG